MKKKIAIAVMLFSFLSGLFFMPAGAALAQNQAIPDTSLTENQNYISKIEPCVFNDDNGTLEGCLLRSFYWLIYFFSAYVTETAASILDFFIGYSIDSKSYSGDNNTFVLRGWAVIRDIANVLFIFTLLYIAIRHILQLAGSDTKKLLKSLIIAALLINFSLFFTKVIIDAGNVLARAFYNNIEVSNDSGEGGKAISQAIAEHIKPQRLLSGDFLTPRPAPGQLPGTLHSGYLFFILALTAFVNFTVAITFISVFLFFIARVIGLWFMMIFSPLAFVSIAVPSSGKMFGDFSWDSWLEQTLKLSFMAPIFMFFLFLLTMFLQIIDTTPIAQDASTTQKLMGVLIPFLVVIVVLNVAKAKAKDMSGKFGEGIKGAAAKLLGATLGFAGMAGGMALGAAAFTARNTFGKSSLRELNSGVHQERLRLYNAKAKEAEESGDKEAARKYRREAMSSANKVAQLDKRAKGSWDIRRNDFLKKNVVDSAIGKKLIGSGGLAQILGNEMTGEKLKFDLGKAKDTSRQKYEDDKKKKALDAAKLYDTGGQAEATIATIGYTAKKGMAAKDELLEHIDKYVSETNENNLMTKKEKDDRLALAAKWRERAETATEASHLEEVITGVLERNPDGSIKKDADGKPIKAKGTADEAKGYAAGGRNAFADVVEARRGNTIVQLLGEDYRPRTRQDYSSVVADQIRKGPKGALDKTLKEILDEENKKNPPSTPPPSAPPPPPPPGPTPP